MDRTGDTPSGDKVPQLKGPKDDQENTRRKMSQQPTPSRTDRNPGSGQQGSKGGGFNAEEAQQGHNQHQVEDHPEGGLQVGQ